MRTIRIPLARTAAAAATAVVLAGGLAGCGGGSSTTTTTTTAAAAAASASPSGQRFNPAMMAKITQCLQAAGIAVPTFTRRPSGAPSSPRPSGQRTGGGFGRFNNPQAQAALKACGITIPTRPPGAGGAVPAPSATN